MKRFLTNGLVVVAMVAGCDAPVQESPRAVSLRPVVVRVVKAKPATIVPVWKGTGVLAPVHKADLAPLEAGKIKEFRVGVGDKVRKGQVLVLMDDALLVSSVAEFQPLKAQYDRAQRLHAGKAMAKAEFEEIEADYVAMNRRVSQIEENTTIKAPFVGVVGRVDGESGEVWFPPQNGSTAVGLVQVLQMTPLKVELAVDQFLFRDLSVGTAVTVCAAVLPDTVFAGSIVRIAPAADPASHRFGVIVQVGNKKELLHPGFSVDVRATMNEMKAVVALPTSALNDSCVYVVEDSVARSRVVKTGRHWEGLVEIRSGLDANEQVVSDCRGIHPGMTVTIRH